MNTKNLSFCLIYYYKLNKNNFLRCKQFNWFDYLISKKYQKIQRMFILNY